MTDFERKGFSGTAPVCHTMALKLMGINSRRRLFGQVPAQMMKQQSLLLFGFGDPWQAELTAVTEAEPDFHHEDGAKAYTKALAGVIDSATIFKLLLEADP